MRVWAAVNAHYANALSESGRGETLVTAEGTIESELKHKRAVVAELTTKTHEIREYIRELEAETEKTTAVANPRLDSTNAPRSDLLGEWHFLYLPDGAVFGYMMIVPGSVRVSEQPAGRCVREAEFTLPSAVLDEMLCVGSDEEKCGRADRRVTCPCCKLDHDRRDFWRHGLHEIITNGNTVAGYCVLSDARDVWRIAPHAGWSEPIYRPRDRCRVNALGRGLSDLGIDHFLSDKHFTRTLDAAFAKLAERLRGHT